MILARTSPGVTPPGSPSLEQQMAEISPLRRLPATNLMGLPTSPFVAAISAIAGWPTAVS